MIPKKVFFKKFFFEIGPFIKPEHFFSFKIFRPTLKHLAMYEFDLSEILSKVLVNLKSTFITLIFFYLVY